MVTTLITPGNSLFETYPLKDNKIVLPSEMDPNISKIVDELRKFLFHLK